MSNHQIHGRPGTTSLQGVLRRARFRWARAVTFAFVFMLTTGRAGAADDWLDDMPSVARVAEVVRDAVNEQVRQYPQLAANPDHLPMQLIGTFVLMRWVMEFQIETQGDLAPARMQRMQQIANDYMQAEYTIGLGTAQRNGYVSRQCQKDGPNRADFKTFPTAQACHDHVTQRVISNVYSAFTWRNTIFPLIFCDRAKYYLALMQDNILTLPAPTRSPAVLGVMPDNSPALGAAYCKAHGGDAQGNGLCDDWERVTESAVAAAQKRGAGCKAIGLTQVRMASGGGLKVLIDPDTASAGSSVRFRVVRANDATADGAPQPVWEGDVRLESSAEPGGPLHAVVAPGEKLPPDPERAFLRVDVASGPSRGPVHCEQPVTKWLQRQLEPAPSGLHGPYGQGQADMPRRGDDGKALATGRGADLAVSANSLLALLLTASNEAGFLVLEDLREPGHYYNTPPVVAKPPDNAAANATVSNGDYASSLRRAFAGSCEVESDFRIVAWAHTHPTQYWGVVQFNDNFSMQDFNFAIDQRRFPGIDFSGGLKIASEFEGSYIIVARNRCIKSFTAQFYDDRDAFSAAELGQVERLVAEPDFVLGARETLWATLTELGMVTLSEHYQRFQQRQREIRCF